MEHAILTSVVRSIEQVVSRREASLTMVRKQSEVKEQREHLGAEQRQRWITDSILQKGSLQIDQLCERFAVSSMTIHRDLDELDRQGVLRKVRGGATVQASYLFESDIQYRLRSSMPEKEAIARHAVSLLEPGQVVMLDDSTTARCLGGLLSVLRPLTVITSGLGLMAQLSKERDIKLIALGGDYLPSFDSFAGLICENAIAGLRVNVLFMSASAVSGGIAFHQNQSIVNVKRAMMKSAARKILMVDQNKFGKVALHKLADLQEFDLVLVDSNLKKSYLDELREGRVPFQVAPI
jgi:DeoR/GlpR family transcriptional regulator of sugar metabolism